jgi:uncharacterized membrane protein
VPVVAPSRDDSFVATASNAVGGPWGRRAIGGASYWSPVVVILLLTTSVFLVGFAAKRPCINANFAGQTVMAHMCYSDIPPLYTDRGIASGGSPYASDNAGATQPLEYPVIIGGVAWATAQLLTTHSAVNFFYLTVVLLFIFAMVTVYATAKTDKRRPWDAAMIALSPGLLLASQINWDWIAVGLTALAMLAWARRHPALAGVLIGLGTATKLYPVLLLGPLFLLCLRARAAKPWLVALVSAAVAWLVVNIPVWLAWPSGWAEFYTFSRTRGADWGSPWLALSLVGHAPGIPLNTLAGGSFVICCLAIGALCLFAPVRPRFAAVSFLVVAAFVLTNKVYSPQYVLWLIPLAVLARPRWRDFLVWQVCETAYIAGIWWHLEFAIGGKGLPDGWYATSILVHILGSLYFCSFVVRDALQPTSDPVRMTLDDMGLERDDPTGGVLDHGRGGWRRTRLDDYAIPAAASAASI